MNFFVLLYGQAQLSYLIVAAQVRRQQGVDFLLFYELGISLLLKLSGKFRNHFTLALVLGLEKLPQFVRPFVLKYNGFTHR
jgi:hypothetical protein